MKLSRPVILSLQNFYFMPTYMYTLIKFFFLLIALNYAENLFAQEDENDNQRLNFSITANPLLIAQNSTPNVTISATKKWIAFVLDGSYYAATGVDKDFNTECQKISFNACIRLYPFNKSFNKFHHLIIEGHSPCPRVLNQNDGYIIRPNGIYVSAGYGIGSIKYNYIPDSSLQSPLTSIPFSVRNNGVIAEAGYQITIRWISIGIGYRVFLSFPKVRGDANPFAETLYTSTYPFKYRLQCSVNLQIGFNLTF